MSRRIPAFCSHCGKSILARADKARQSHVYCSQDCAKAALRLVCPVSAERLRELYWEESKSVADIAATVSDLMIGGRVPSVSTVRRWFRESQTGLRDPKITKRFWVRRNPVKAKAETARLHDAVRQMIKEGRRFGRPLTKKDAARGRRIAGKKRREQSYREIECCYCGKLFLRLRSQITFKEQRGITRFFCSRSCKSKSDAPLKDYSVREIRQCGECRKPIDKAISHFVTEVSYCSTRCANIARGKRQYEESHPEFTCPQCGLAFRKERNVVKSKIEQGLPIYCGMSCAAKNKKKKTND